MAFVDTQPAPIDRGDAAADWARFRIRHPSKLLGALRDLCRNDTPLVVGAPGSKTLQVSLWAVDDVKRRLHFKIAADAPAFSDLSLEPELWAAAYVDDDKLQFPLGGVRFGVDRGHQVLTADLPDHIYCLPRRQAVRVRRNDVDGPKLSFTHPAAPGQVHTLKLLDISNTGCALLCPAGGPMLPLGLVLKQVEVELDSNHILFSDLLVHHTTLHNRRDQSTRVGCEWQGMPEVARERLREWIKGGSRRRDLMSLELL